MSKEQATGDTTVRAPLMRSSSTFNKRDKKSTVFTEDSKYLGSVHTYHEEEKQGLVDYVNGLLHNHYSKHTSINPKSNDIFEIIKDGILLCRIINAIQPGVIEEGKVNMKDRLSIFERGENLNLALATAQDAFNISFVNIGTEDVMEGRPVLVLSLLWQLVNVDLRTRVRFHSREIDYLKEDEPDGAGAEVPIDINLPEELKILLRWVNHQLAEAGSDRRINNFSGDIKDSVVYIVLLHQLAPRVCTLDALNEPDLLVRANLVLESADLVGCKKFLSPDDIIQGNQRLNFAFIAYLFTKFNLPPKLVENRIADARLDEQAIELADIHKDRRDTRVTLSISQDKVKESGQKIEVERSALKKEENELQERIVVLAEKKRDQDEKYTKKIELLKERVAAAQAAQLPSVEELQKQIAIEEAEQQEILKDREVKREELKELEVDVAVQQAKRAKEESLLTRVENEIKTMETTHTAQTKALNERIEALGITSLKERLDQAVAQTVVATTANKTLIKKRNELVEDVKEESGARSRAEAARKRVEAELEKAKKSLDDTSKTKTATAAASTRLERKLVGIKTEIEKVKKDVIRVEYQTKVAKDDAIAITEQAQKLAREKVSLKANMDVLQEEVEDTEDQLVEEAVKTEERVSEIVVQNEQILEIDRKKNKEEIQQHKIVNDKLAGQLANVASDLENRQVELAVKTGIVFLRDEEVRSLQEELIVAKDDVRDLERVTKQLQKQQIRAEAQIGEEALLKWKDDEEIRALEEENAKSEITKNERLAKREKLASELREKELVARNTVEIAGALLRTRVSEAAVDSLVLDNDNDGDDNANSKLKKIVSDAERKRKVMISNKEFTHAQAMKREKEHHEKKLQQLGENTSKTTTTTTNTHNNTNSNNENSIHISDNDHHQQ